MVNGRDPVMEGQNSNDGSIPVTLSSEQDTYLSNIETFTSQIQGSSSLTQAVLGGQSDAAIVSDTTGSISGKMRGLVKWAYERMPTSLGAKSSANSFPTVLSTEQEGLIGALTETAPGTDTASSGLNGRLQRLAQRVTSLIALLPTALTGSGNLKVANLPETAGGCSAFELVSAASTNATSVKGSAGQVYGVQVFNLNAAARYLKFYNVSGTPNPASDTVIKSIMIPGNTAGAGVVIPLPYGLAFSTGIGIALVTGISNTDNTAVAANEIVVNIDYK